MRFWVGEYPPDPTFQPEREGWTKVREPGIAVAWLLAIPAMAALAVGTAFAFAAVSRPAGGTPDRPVYTTPLVPLLAMVGVVLGTAVAHEAAHLVAHPRFGLSPASVVGSWPKAGVLYVLYDGVLSRTRYLWVVALPLVVLTFGPLAVCSVVGEVPVWLAGVAVVNALGSGFDVLAILLVLRQVPAGALVRGHGFDFYWRPRHLVEPESVPGTAAPAAEPLDAPDTRGDLASGGR